MADELLTEQQQAENVKQWVQQNGLVLAAGVVLGLSLLFGVNQWRNYQERHAEQASDVYEALLQSVRSNQVSQAEAGLATLTADYGSTPYTDLARLSVAHLYLDQGQADQAAELLRKVVDSAATSEMQLIARLRLARVLNQQEKYDEALEVLTDPKSAAYAPAFHDVRGDVYFAMGKFDEARSQYEQALHGGDAALVIDRGYVEAKLDDLGGALTPEVTPQVTPEATSSVTPDTKAKE